tara:strand:+ start:876 stop:1142 length:267 start_codon:yes stop_codon:yes gene_type:complete
MSVCCRIQFSQVLFHRGFGHNGKPLPSFGGNLKGKAMEIVLKLSVEEVNSVLQVLGELPSKTGAWPLILKIKNQAQEQLPKQEEPPVQ